LLRLNPPDRVLQHHLSRRFFHRKVLPRKLIHHRVDLADRKVDAVSGESASRETGTETAVIWKQRKISEEWGGDRKERGRTWSALARPSDVEGREELERVGPVLAGRKYSVSSLLVSFLLRFADSTKCEKELT
jgi:hypothetical protein